MAISFSTPLVRRAIAIGLCLAGATWHPSLHAQLAGSDLKRLTLEQLLEVEVRTASRAGEPWWRTTAAKTVLTYDDIRRSGAGTLVELLRMVPGVHVAQIDGNKFAVGIRGFTDRLSRAMLVLIDGRAVYSPLFAGTFWEAQDTLLEDVDRVEVIRGPGGTLWGANAVNGIVNIITKPASETRGGFLKARGGNVEHGLVGARYGGRVGTTDYRVYAKGFDRGPQRHGDGGDFDTWDGLQTGFRLDRRTAGGGGVTMQGDAYTADVGQRVTVTTYTPPFARVVEDPVGISGANVLARWQSRTSASGGVTAHLYYDTTSRREPAFFERRHTVDLDVQRGTRPWRRHEVVFGGGYRVTADRTDAIPIRQFTPADRTQQILSAFVQDQITLVPQRLDAVVGAKLQHNTFSGFALQPSGRLLWTPHADHAVTASVTRAVRTPSRVEIDYTTGSVLNPAIPMFLRLAPNDDFESEKMAAYELGYRTRPHSRVLLSANSFFNHHREALSAVIGTAFVEPGSPSTRVILPVQFQNGLHGNSHGVEVASDVRVGPRWRWTSGYSWLRVQLTRDPGEAPDVSQERRNEGGSPQHQVFNGLAIDLPGRVEFDWKLRYVGALPAVAVDAYHTSDVRLAWNTSRGLSLIVVGRNLHEPYHREFIGSGGNIDIRRAVSAGATWRW